MALNSYQQHMKVVVRVRPNSRRELESNQMAILKVLDETTILFDPDEDYDEFFFQGIKLTHRDITKKTHKKLTMEYDQVYDGEATNNDVFNDCTKPLIKSVMNGYNCSVFVYGATGAGKTFTMLGNHESPGISYLTMKELFTQIQTYQDNRKFDIGISYLEVYNERVMNLLTKSGPLKLREDVNGVVVSGLALKPIYNANELLNLLELGNKNRTQHPTDANAESSRSHAIFQVHIRMTEKKTGQKRTVKLSMIDLAGSERAASTKGMGARFKEGASINKSLLALGNCINNLADGLKHIPYRDSNLTRILKDSLGGNCQTIMIANVSPSSLTYEDTYNTLKYASRAKKIRSTITQNILKANMPKDYYVKKVNSQMSEIEALKAQLAAATPVPKSNPSEQNIIRDLEAKLAAANAKPYTHHTNIDEKIILETWYQRIDKICEKLIKSQQQYFGAQSKEKILKFRAKLKEYAEKSKDIMTLDGMKLKEDITRYEASIDRVGTQIMKQKDEMSRWRKIHEENLRDFRKLQLQINEEKFSEILAIYLRWKENEIKISQQNIQIAHNKKINLLYCSDLEYLRKLNMLALEMIGRNYYLFRAKKILDVKFDENFETLISMCNGNSIKFIDDKSADTDQNIDLATINFDDDNNTVTYGNDEVYEPLPIRNKRRDCGDNKDECPDSGGLSKKRNRNLFTNHDTTYDTGLGMDFLDPNEVLFKHPSGCLKKDLDPNVTFDVGATSTDNSQNPKNMEVMKHILNEQNVNASNRAKISKALLKSNVTRQNILKTINVAITNKENKRLSAGRIRKSPRHDSAAGNATAAASYLTHRRPKTPKKTFGFDHLNSIQVRINRAASLRNKK